MGIRSSLVRGSLSGEEAGSERYPGKYNCVVLRPDGGSHYQPLYIRIIEILHNKRGEYSLSAHLLSTDYVPRIDGASCHGVTGGTRLSCSCWWVSELPALRIPPALEASPPACPQQVQRWWEELGTLEEMACLGRPFPRGLPCSKESRISKTPRFCLESHRIPN